MKQRYVRLIFSFVFIIVFMIFGHTNVHAQDEHNYEKEIIEEASCTTEGTIQYTCTTCGDTYTEKIEPTGHTSITFDSIPATTSSNGYTAGEKCSACDEILSGCETIYKIDSITLSSTSYTYDGTAKKPSVQVLDSQSNIISSTYYTVTYDNNINAGTAKAIVTFKDNYSGTLTKTFIINTKSISKFTATLSKTSYTYTGSSIKTTVTVKDASGNKLISGTDFSVSYKNNTNVGTATATITGKGNYTGTITKTFKIAKRSLSNYTISLSTTSYTYNGSTRKPTVTVKNGSTTISSANYTVSYASGRKNVGSYKVTIKGKGNYTGTITKTFIINKASYNPTIKSYTGTYDGKSHTITISNVKSGSTIKYKTSSSASYTSTKPTRTSTGTTTVYYQITNSNYKTITGTSKITINAKTQNISNYTITLSQTKYSYTGKAIQPIVTLKNGSTTISSSNCTVTYCNNTKVGTATITVKGK